MILYIYIHIISINSVDSHPCMMRANCQAWQLVPLQLWSMSPLARCDAKNVFWLVDRPLEAVRANILSVHFPYTCLLLVVHQCTSYRLFLLRLEACRDLASLHEQVVATSSDRWASWSVCLCGPVFEPLEDTCMQGTWTEINKQHAKCT